MDLTAALYDRLTGDATLTAMLATFGGEPAVFTTDPAPEKAELPYIVSAGSVSDSPMDTKTTRGRQVWRDVRCYAPAIGSAVVIEAIAERVRELLHRHQLAVSGMETWIAEVTGPIVADEEDAYGRILTVRLVMMESVGGML
jgi:hypothetical protein